MAAAGSYERASKLYERLEGRAVGTLLSQQAQLERAYLMNKAGEKAQSLAILERFIKIHPTSPALDYAKTWPKGISRPRETRTSRSSNWQRNSPSPNMRLTPPPGWTTL